MAARIAAAAATVAIEQLAGHVRVRDLARRFVLQLLQAASSAAVAERLPLFARQLRELLAPPKRLRFHPHIVGEHRGPDVAPPRLAALDDLAAGELDDVAAAGGRLEIV